MTMRLSASRSSIAVSQSRRGATSLPDRRRGTYGSLLRVIETTWTRQLPKHCRASASVGRRCCSNSVELAYPSDRRVGRNFSVRWRSPSENSTDPHPRPLGPRARQPVTADVRVLLLALRPEPECDLGEVGRLGARSCEKVRQCSSRPARGAARRLRLPLHAAVGVNPVARCSGRIAGHGRAFAIRR